MSARSLYSRSVLFPPATNRYHSKQRYRPSLAHRGKANHRRERGKEETADSNNELDTEASWYLPSPDGIEDLPSTAVLQADEPTAVNVIAHPPLNIQNMINAPDQLPHPLATNFWIPLPQPRHTTCTSQADEVPLPMKIIITFLLLGSLMFWALLFGPGSCHRPILRRRKPILSLPAVRDRQRAAGGARLPTRNQNTVISQTNYNTDPRTETQRQLGTRRHASPAMVGRTTPQGVADNRSATSGQEIHAEQEQHPFTVIANRASSSALLSNTTTTPIVSGPTVIFVFNSSDHLQLGSDVGSAFDATTTRDQRPNIVSRNSLIHTLKGATVFRQGTNGPASSDSQTSEAIDRALSKATYYTLSPYLPESIPSPSHSQFVEGPDSQQEHGLGGANTQLGQEREPRVSTRLSSPASPDDATQIIKGMKPVERETANVDIAHDDPVDPTALGSPTSVASIHASASDAERLIPQRATLEKVIKDQSPQE